MLRFILEIPTLNLALSATASPLLCMTAASQIAVLYDQAWPMIITWPRIAKFIHTMMGFHLVEPQSEEKDFIHHRGVVNQGISEASKNILRFALVLLVKIIKLTISRLGIPIGLAGCKHSHSFKQISQAQRASAM